MTVLQPFHLLRYRPRSVLQLISCLPFLIFLPADLWCVYTFEVSIFIPNTAIHWLLLEVTQPPEKPPTAPSSLTTSLNVGGQTQVYQQMENIAASLLGSPCAGRRISAPHCPSPLAQSECHALHTIAEDDEV